MALGLLERLHFPVGVFQNLKVQTAETGVDGAVNAVGFVVGVIAPVRAQGGKHLVQGGAVAVKHQGGVRHIPLIDGIDGNVGKDLGRVLKAGQGGFFCL